MKSEGRNLVVCIDGTANKFGEKVHTLFGFSAQHRLTYALQNTNVVELCSRLTLEAKRYIDRVQVTYYNSGIGTFVPNRRSIKRFGQWLDSTMDLAFAW
jgi:uncharacterized protein (DUF2235 family)